MFIVPSETLKERLATCMSCEKLTGYVMLRCSMCGCSIKGKSILARESCPMGKWSKVEDSSSVT